MIDHEMNGAPADGQRRLSAAPDEGQPVAVLPVPSDPVRILLVDDHMLVRAGLAQVIGSVPGFTVVAEAETGEEALLLCQRLRPDVVLMDVRMPGLGGIAATEALCKLHPQVAVIALSTFADAETVARMLAAGARGFLSKSVSAHDLRQAIRKVHGGESVVDAGCPRQAASHVEPTPPREEHLELSTQQRRVLALLSKGCTNPEIARYLCISVPTARYHVSAVLLKLGVSNRAEAAAMAIRNRLVNHSDF